MLLLALLVVAIAAADAVNPSTVVPALVYALRPQPARNVARFTAGVFGVSTAGGLGLLFGPGEAVLARAAHPRPHTLHLIELATGLVLVAVAGALWLGRRTVERQLQRSRRPGSRAFVLGAAIMATELPTAFPYFGALAAIAGADRGASTSIALVLVYNVVFTTPLVAILALRTLGGERADPLTERVERLLVRRAPVAFPLALGLIGAIVTTAAAIRLAP